MLPINLVIQPSKTTESMKIVLFSSWTESVNNRCPRILKIQHFLKTPCKMKAIAFCMFLLASSVVGLEEGPVKEKRCFTPPSPAVVALDTKWLGSFDYYYVPIWSQFYATRTASEVFGRDASLIGAHEIQPASCLLFGKDDVLSAWGRAVQLNATRDSSSITFKAPWSGAKKGKFSFHKTDNKSYLLGVTCWEDDEAGWTVITPKPILEEKAKKDILKYIKSLGFDVKKAVEEDYAFCHGRYGVVLRQPLVLLPPRPYYFYSSLWKK